MHFIYKSLTLKVLERMCIKYLCIVFVSISISYSNNNYEVCREYFVILQA